ncbi:protein argonaute-2-like [Dermatophagoides pteronyssinus]|uniref:protein argonaute-2-like n=1 Tax=Dermatophagoides pteronyssinus TaxID=6956 RepID=UPI003F66E00E
MSFRGRSRPRFGFRGAISSSRRSSTPEPRSPPPPEIEEKTTQDTSVSSAIILSSSSSSLSLPSTIQSREQSLEPQQQRRPTSRDIPTGIRSIGGTTRIQRPDYSKYPESRDYPIVRTSEYEPGKHGRKIELLANFMLLNVQPTIVHQYDLNFRFKNGEQQSGTVIPIAENERMQKFFARIIPQLVAKFIQINDNVFARLSQYVYDNGKNIYTTELIDTGILCKEFSDDINGRRKEFLVEISKVQTIDLSQIPEYYSGRISNISEVAINFLEILLQNICLKKYQFHRRNLYDCQNGLIRGPKQFIQFVQGFSTAVHRTQFGPSLNLHLKTSCMISLSAETLIQLIAMLLDGRDPRQLTSSSSSSRDLERINKILRGLDVYSRHMGRRMNYKIKGILSRKPNELSFEMRQNGNGSGGDGDGQEVRSITIKDYFMEKYHIELNNDYPVVQLIGRPNFYMPSELLIMNEKQFLNTSKIDSTIQNDLLHSSTNKPLIYLNNVTRFANEIAEIDPERMNHFGVDLQPRPVRFFGRIFDPIRCIGNQRNDRFASTISTAGGNSSSAAKWAFFSFDERFNRRDIDSFVHELKQTSRRFGLDLSNCLEQQLVPINQQNLNDVGNVFANILQHLPSCNLLIIALPQISLLYNMVKHFGDQKFGIVTQCLNVEKAKRRNRGYVENLLLKINGKLGGQNSYIDLNVLKALPLDPTKTMAIGIDVNHPGIGEKIQSSIACTIGSLDQHFTRYTASVRAQKQEKIEMISVLEEMINELLIEYEKYNKYLPENFIIFRDGIGDGQFLLAQNEIDQIRRAIRQKVRNGKLMYIVTQKRHQTRFVLSKPSGSMDRPIYNVPSGTIVDHTIIDPNYHMFYINSHFSPLGTSRPLKYVVLHNDYERRQMSQDDIQKFCFYLCHNCTRYRGGPIAMPVPVRYADLCAYRSKLHLEGQHASRQIPLECQEEFERHIIQQLNKLVKLNDKIKNTLFYC